MKVLELYIFVNNLLKSTIKQKNIKIQPYANEINSTIRILHFKNIIWYTLIRNCNRFIVMNYIFTINATKTYQLNSN